MRRNKVGSAEERGRSVKELRDHVRKGCVEEFELYFEGTGELPEGFTQRRDWMRGLLY